MTDIFEEVDQSLREDTFATWWKRWQWLIYGLVAVAILGVAGLEIYRGIRAEEINKAAVIYDAGFAAQEKNDLTTARASFAQLETDKTGFKALAGHMLAGVEKELTNDTAAVEAHLSAAAAADKGVMGDLAIIKLAYLKADTGTLAEVEAVLKPLLDRTGQASALAPNSSAPRLSPKAMSSAPVLNSKPWRLTLKPHRASSAASSRRCPRCPHARSISTPPPLRRQHRRRLLPQPRRLPPLRHPRRRPNDISDA